jgi:hypothetical protein
MEVTTNSLLPRLARRILALLIIGTGTTLFSQTIITFDVPNSSNTHPTAINGKGAITGYYIPSSGGGESGFIRHPGGRVVFFDVPDVAGTFPMDINDIGQVIGFWSRPGEQLGFLRQRDGTVVQIPSAPAPSSSTQKALQQAVTYVGSLKPQCGNNDSNVPLAINDLGQITGSTNGSGALGFLENANGTTIDFDVQPNSPGLIKGTCPQAINLWGDITGYYFNNGIGAGVQLPRGFLRQRDGNIVTFGPANATQTIPMAINLFGQITGFYSDDTGTHGFVRQPNGNIKSFDPADSNNTEPTGINAWGEVTGFYIGPDGIAHSFLREANGAMITFDVPNSQGTFARSINLQGTITGDYFDGSSYHGFIRKRR